MVNLDLTANEMQILLSVTSDIAHHGEAHHALWVKVSEEFAREWQRVRDKERLFAEMGWDN